VGADPTDCHYPSSPVWVSSCVLLLRAVEEESWNSFISARSSVHLRISKGEGKVPVLN
jgi:hypothetical protein